MPLFERSPQAQLVLESMPMGDLEFFARELEAWRDSREREAMIDGWRYYRGDQDILRRKRTVIGREGEQVPVENLPNNRILDNQYAKHLDQKKNYLLGKAVTFESENREYAQRVSGVLGRRFMRTLKNAGCQALCGGIAWLYPYYDAGGELSFALFPAYEILPFWKDGAHTELDCALRLYTAQVYVGREKKTVEKVDLLEPDGLSRFCLSGGALIPEGAKQSYMTAVGMGQGYSWGRVPLIALKNGSREEPLLSRVRQLQDALNQVFSDFVNCMQEDVRNTVLVLKNYDGTDLGEFRKNLATYGAVKVRSCEGQSGGIDTLQIEVRADNYKIILELLKKALIENIRSYDAKNDRSYSNQMNIQSMYADIDLDANDMETELQAAFEEILWFVNRYLAISGRGSFEGVPLEVIFNRDMLINESEAIENCVKSQGLLSRESLVAQHPWVKNPARELERRAAQEPGTKGENRGGQTGLFISERGDAGNGRPMRPKTVGSRSRLQT